MVFNSFEYAVFLPAVFLIYWLLFRNKMRVQNLLLVGASYLFYGWWDWRFLGLLLLSTSVDFFIGKSIEQSKNIRHKKTLLFISLGVNLGVLGFFKYYNFFIDNLATAYNWAGHDFNLTTLHIILPVGISFYTFQTLSYTLDVYKGKIKASNDFISFAAFVSFFPQLVAGPIERATNLLPQFQSNRKFSYGQSVDGLRQILWGLFKKVMIADNCAFLVNDIFKGSEHYGGSTLAIGAILFAFQIYGDFSGYSDIAIGTARLFGFNLMQNFNFPYFSRDIAEFWRKWHISLSTWFRDYVYIPLGGSRVKKARRITNVMVVFLISGFWHGANWTFLAWGLLHALMFLPLLLFNRNRKNLGSVATTGLVPNWKDLFSMVLTFSLTTFAWIFFRAETIGHALDYVRRIFSKSLFSRPEVMLDNKVLLFFCFFLVMEWVGKTEQFAIQKILINKPRSIRWLLYVGLIVAILLYGGIQQDFIYFQF